MIAFFANICYNKENVFSRRKGSDAKVTENETHRVRLP